MNICFSCNAENSDGSKLCSKCGNWIGSSSNVKNEARKVPVNPASSILLIPPRPYFINRPWLTDWVFWLAVVLATIGGSQSLYREGSSGLGSVTTAVLISGFVTILITISISFVLFGIIPAAIRWPFRKGKFLRLLDAQPEDATAGWKKDPINPSGQRWWTGDEWTQGTRPQQNEKSGGASWAVIGGVFAIVLIAFLLGTGNRGFNTQVYFDNVDIESFYSQLDLPHSFEIVDTATASRLTESFDDVTLGMNDYFGVKVNPNDVFPAYRQLIVKLNTINTYQADMARWLGPTITQEQIGGNDAPSLSALRVLSKELESFIQVRQSFYAALETCEPLNAPGRLFSDCDETVFNLAEGTLETTNESLQLAYRAVLESMPNE
jgi:hypothetical protein